VWLLARIQSLVPVNEPAIRVVVEVGWTRTVQREYVLPIDPPALGRASAAWERQPVQAPPA
jgi:Tfp pilus assembly protein FimV